MNYLSVCSGIEAATVAWHSLGWKAAAFSEIEKFPRQVLAHHYPHVPLHGDFTTIKGDEYGSVDLLVGGTPCQSFSVAGLRKGLDDPRGNLMLEYGSLARRLGAKWLVWENVPGVLSANRGRDFGTFLGMLAELGYGFAYRVLDAQYFGVAQRRRRVFVVGYLGDWRRAAAVLFERDSLCGNPAPSRKTGQEVAATLSTGFGSRGVDSDQIANGNYALGTWPAQVAPTLNASFGSKQGLEDQHIKGGQDGLSQVAKCLVTKTRIDAETETLIPMNGGHFSFAQTTPTLTSNGDAHTGFRDEHGLVCYPMNTQVITRHEALGEGTGFGLGEPTDPAFTLSKAHSHAVAVSKIVGALACNTGPNGHDSGNFACNQAVDAGHVIPIAWSEELTASENLAGTIQRGGAGGRHDGVMQPNMAVRRLTPVECERLQGFPDGYTDIKPNGKPTPDGPRYKALGNSMAVPVMRWIGERINQVEAI